MAINALPHLKNLHWSASGCSLQENYISIYRIIQAQNAKKIQYVEFLFTHVENLPPINASSSPVMRFPWQSMSCQRKLFRKFLEYTILQ